MSIIILASAFTPHRALIEFLMSSQILLPNLKESSPILRNLLETYNLVRQRMSTNDLRTFKHLQVTS